MDSNHEQDQDLSPFFDTTVGDPKKKFSGLLNTWMTMAMRNEDQTAWDILFKHDSEEWPRLFVELEQQFGDGHYEERKYLLDTVVKALGGGRRVDLNAVHRVLAEAQWRQRETIREEKMIDYQRLLRDHQKLVELLDKILTRVRESCSRLFRFGMLDLFDAESIDKVETISRMGELQKSLRRDSSIAVAPKAPFRRLHAGRRSQPWLKSARDELTRLRVPLGMREDLLQAVGLIAYTAE